jgi:hypothetical protein
MLLLMQGFVEGVTTQNLQKLFTILCVWCVYACAGRGKGVDRKAVGRKRG